MMCVTQLAWCLVCGKSKRKTTRPRPDGACGEIPWPRAASGKLFCPQLHHPSPPPRGLGRHLCVLQTLCVSFRGSELAGHASSASRCEGPLLFGKLALFFCGLFRVSTLPRSVLVFYMFQENHAFHFIKFLEFICIELSKITFYNFLENIYF